MSKLYNRARMTITSTGTGSVSLGVAVAGYQTFSSAGAQNNDVVSYTIEDGLNWEIGTGTYNSVAGTLSRTVTQSYNGTTYGTTAISVTTNAQVFISALAADLQYGTSAYNLVQLDSNAKIPALDGSQITNLNVGNAASGTLSVSRGGTGISSFGTGVATALGNNTNAASGLAVLNGSGSLAVGQGGTGLTSLTAGYIPYASSSSAFSFSNLYSDGSNLGLGVTPSTWNTGVIALQSAYGVIAGNLQANIVQNANYNSGWVYTATAAATQYQQTSGQHRWYNAPSGTANAAISFTQAMTLDASGNLGIGTGSSTISARLDVSNSGKIHIGDYPSSYGQMFISAGVTARIQFGDQSTSSSYSLAFGNGSQSSPNDLMILSGSGNLAVGLTPSSYSTGRAIEVGKAGNGMWSFAEGEMYYTTSAPYIGGGWVYGSATKKPAMISLGESTGLVRIYTCTTTGIVGSALSWTSGPYVANGGTSWTTASDERLKDIIEPITNGLNKISQLRSVIGKFKTDSEGTRRAFLIAQDVQKVLPEAVEDSKPDELGLNYSDIIPLLVSAIKELAANVQALEAKVA